MQKFRKILAIVLCLAMVFTISPVNVMAADGENGSVKITVNYVYDSNGAMVAQPFKAEIENGSAFEKEITVPAVLNYSVPADKASGIGTGITLNSTDEGDVLSFDLESVTSDVTVTLKYVAGQSTYTVNHYLENLDDDEYTLDKTIELTGDIDAYTEAVANSYTGFVCDGVPKYTVAADGTTVVDIYYDRQRYLVQFNVNGGKNGPEPVYGKYGAPLTVSSVPTRAGYTFVGWGVEELPTTIQNNVTYKAQWEANSDKTDYTIVIWGQNANDNEYSYLKSEAAHGVPGEDVTWDESKRICEGSHEHNEDCYNLTCGKVEHTHNATDCTLDCQHEHNASCYGAGNASTPRDADIAQFRSLTGDSLVDGYVYRVECDSWYQGYKKNYIYYDGRWYEYEGTLGDKVKNTGKMNAHGHYAQRGGQNNVDQFFAYESVLNCSHKHSSSCYSCGLEAHTHSALGGDCYTLICDKEAHTHTKDCKTMGDIAPDSSLWVFDHSETVEVEADGTTVLNVYFNRVEFTMTFKSSDGRNTVGTIHDRWGASIADRFKAICESSGYSAWSKSTNTNSSRNYFGVMPEENQTWYGHRIDGSQATMRYFGEDLNGNYNEIFNVTGNFGGYTTDDNDLYEFEGYTLNRTKSSDSMGKTIRQDNIKFYYDRNSYNLEFHSASRSKADKTESVKYQANLGQYDYVPTEKPNNVEDDAVFMGWYQNPECTGEQYDLAAHNMPSNNLVLYAKWVDGLYKVETFTDASLDTYYVYDGYNGIQENIVKYTVAPETPKNPSTEGMAFAGWFYDDNGTEKAFSFTMPITRDYKLYPKFTDRVMVSYTVHYYKEGTTEKVADDKSGTALIGTTVTEKAKMGDELNLAGDETYFPTSTSTSVVLSEEDMEIIFYYSEAQGAQYTVKYVDKYGNDLLEPSVKSTDSSSVVEEYVEIENYWPQVTSQSLELQADSEKNVITFVYNENQATIAYRAETGGSVSRESEKVDMFTGTALGSNATPSEGYVFRGWYDGSTLVSSNPSFVPTKGGKIWQDKTYTAKFESMVTISYVAVGGGSVSSASETVAVESGTAAGSTAVPAENYSFAGWFKDAECTEAVDSGWINGYKCTPAKENGRYQSATYYAKFEMNTSTLTITKTGMSAGETAIFEIKDGTNTVATVTVPGNNGSVTVSGVTIGKTYTVEEKGDWSWKYNKANSQTKTISATAGQNVLTFNNTTKDTSWLNAEASATNVWDNGVVSRVTAAQGVK